RCPLAEPRVACYGRSNPSRVNAAHTYATAFQFVAQRFGKAAHGKLACGVSRLHRRRDESEHARQIDDMRPRLALEQRQKIPDAVNRAPEIDVHQPAEVNFWGAVYGVRYFLP